MKSVLIDSLASVNAFQKANFATYITGKTLHEEINV